MPSLRLAQQRLASGRRNLEDALVVRESLPTLSLLGQARARSGVSGGPLNPEWCDWFMGFPIGWTALEPLEMRKFQQWQHLHGGR
mgnify:FL=1